MTQQDRKTKATKIIQAALDELFELKFGKKEISSLFHLLLTEKSLKRQSIHIAGIDCNPEALSVFDRQLRHVANIQLHCFMLDELRDDPMIKTRLAEFELILTTSTHYREITELVPELKDRIVQAAVSPGRQTVVDLAKIPATSQIGIVTQSRNFLKIIKNKLADFQVNRKDIKHVFEDDLEAFPEFIKDIDILITPPKCALESARDLKVHFQNFRAKGGGIIRFDYQIERGALTHIEEKITQLTKTGPDSTQGALS